MSDLVALSALVTVLRDAGVSTYEGPVPGWEVQTGDGYASVHSVKLTIRPPAPPAPAQKLPETPRDPAPRIPAGLHGVV